MAYLEIKRGDVVTRAQLGDAATIGRHADNTIVINDPDISRRHCVIERGEQGFRLADVASRNGTRLNGKVIDQHTLANGDVIRIGTTDLRFVDAVITNGWRRSRLVAPALIVAGCAAAIFAITFFTGALDGFFPPDEATTNFDGEFTSRDRSSRGELDADASAYAEITPDNAARMIKTHLDRPVRARFFGTPVKFPDATLRWELPPDGTVVAIIDRGGEHVEILADEPNVVEAELFGILERGDREDAYVLRVGEMRLIGAWTGKDDELRPATRQLLGQRFVIEKQFSVAGADAGVEN